MSRKHKTGRRVALAYPVAVPWMGLFMRGVADYADRHGEWTILTSPPTLSGAGEHAMSVRTLRGWHGDGVIAALSSAEDARAARGLGIPVVNLSRALERSSLPRVMIDHDTTGRLAAEHLLARVFRRLAYCGTEGLHFSRLRAEGFADVAREAGAACHVLQALAPGRAGATWPKHTVPLERWLRRLRVDRAKELLTLPVRSKLETVAEACGFGSAERLRLVFRRVTGWTPLEYRRRQHPAMG